ncbi:MAG: hypothetical protein SOX56_05855 [[Pasteurella] mairii]|uniref:Transmembrane protein n=1 Tax=[Pasteurella] mairii TaxID=757 RepID=A0A379B3Z7_9PAST|nr:hypothetical protein [[Pasteurella] mairii]SUB33344.1 Uncharacterised protein [[Pasteurella] mairii]
MSKKINIWIIIKDHLNTLRDHENGKISKLDILTFLVCPFLIVVSLVVYQYAINKELVSLIVNFASIVTSLLISVLVLIYDQYSKIEVSNNIQKLKKEVLEQLFSNVSFTILMGIITVIFCLLLNSFPVDKNGFYQTVNINIKEYTTTLSIILFTPTILFFLLEMILTLFMALKRLHIVFFVK